MRLRLVRILIYGGLTALGLGLFRVQVLQGPSYRILSEQNRIRLIPMEALRGKVFDRAQRLLATNRISYDVAATPEDVTPPVFAILAKTLNIPEAEIRKRMSAPREYSFSPALIKSDIPREKVFELEELKPVLPGVFIQVDGVRYYPYRTTASHLIGYIGKINKREYIKFSQERFGMHSLVGRAGIEKIYDDPLRGWRGGRQVEVDAKGNFVRILSEKKAAPGEDITLTLDLEFQQKIEAMLVGKRASVAVLDLDSEGLLALASSPAYDPNIFVSPGRSQERIDILRDKSSPMLDRGTGSAYPPGSVFKLVTAIAGLETGKITPETRFFCQGYFKLGNRKFHCWDKEGHGSLNLYEAIERSCNVYFYQLGNRLSADEIAHYARAFGLGEVLQLEVTDMTPGIVPDKIWRQQHVSEAWYAGDTLSFAIGQSYLLTSPLQILKLSAIIAKNGLMVEPRLVLGSGAGGEPEKVKRVAVSEANIKVIQKAMLNVVQSDRGTGQFARVNFDKMAAKTGTAQVPPNQAHSWMTGFFPYENPKIAFVAFVENGGPGGITAAKIVNDMIKLWHSTYGTTLA